MRSWWTCISKGMALPCATWRTPEKGGFGAYAPIRRGRDKIRLLCEFLVDRRLGCIIVSRICRLGCCVLLIRRLLERSQQLPMLFLKLQRLCSSTAAQCMFGRLCFVVLCCLVLQRYRNDPLSPAERHYNEASGEMCARNNAVYAHARPNKTAWPGHRKAGLAESTAGNTAKPRRMGHVQLKRYSGENGRAPKLRGFLRSEYPEKDGQRHLTETTIE